MKRVYAKFIIPDFWGKTITFIAVERIAAKVPGGAGSTVKTRVTGVLQEREPQWDRRAVKIRVDDKWYVIYHTSIVEIQE